MKIELFLDEDVHSGLAHNQVFKDRADIERLENDVRDLDIQKETYCNIGNNGWYIYDAFHIVFS